MRPRATSSSVCLLTSSSSGDRLDMESDRLKADLMHVSSGGASRGSNQTVLRINIRGNISDKWEAMEHVIKKVRILPTYFIKEMLPKADVESTITSML